MMVVLIINIVAIVWIQILPDDADTTSPDTIDSVCLYIYIAEVVLKWIGLGIEKYYEDEWNQFDFVMVLISLFSNLLQSILNVLQ
jgi:hypothetical protein